LFIVVAPLVAPCLLDFVVLFAIPCLLNVDSSCLLDDVAPLTAPYLLDVVTSFIVLCLLDVATPY
jgi:hypothetical protein